MKYPDGELPTEQYGGRERDENYASVDKTETWCSNSDVRIRVSSGFVVELKNKNRCQF